MHIYNDEHCYFIQGTGTLTVSIQDINDNYPQCDETSYTLTLPEDTGWYSLGIQYEYAWLKIM